MLPSGHRLHRMLAMAARKRAHSMRSLRLAAFAIALLVIWQFYPSAACADPHNCPANDLNAGCGNPNTTCKDLGGFNKSACSPKERCTGSVKIEPKGGSVKVGVPFTVNVTPSGFNLEKPEWYTEASKMFVDTGTVTGVQTFDLDNEVPHTATMTFPSAGTYTVKVTAIGQYSNMVGSGSMNWCYRCCRHDQMTVTVSP